ncbi:hypothetical protein [Chromobacterium phragmitis]|nr:hypothetical protein [Chromobacterium phragmitis]
MGRILAQRGRRPFIEALHALLTVRAALAPLVGNAQDASHG